MKNVRYWSIALIASVSIGIAQEVESNQYLIFKVEYWNKQEMDYSSEAYSIMALENLEDFKISNQYIQYPPNITFRITQNGGYYISGAFMDLYTLGCCEYSDIEKAMQMLKNDELGFDEINRYSNSNSISFLSFDKVSCRRYKFKKDSSVYLIKVWIAELEFCICPLYMESPQQTIYSNQAAYLKKINSIDKPSNKVGRQTKMILRALVELY